MNSLLLLVTSSVTGSANCLSALALCRAACEAGVRVSVFFYGDGVENSNTYMMPGNDDLNVRQAWQALAECYQVELLVCNTAANNRGIIGEDDARSSNAYNLHAPFVAGGLAEFAARSQKVDKVVQL